VPVQADIAGESVEGVRGGIAAAVVVDCADFGLAPRADGTGADDLDLLDVGMVVVERRARMGAKAERAAEGDVVGTRAEGSVALNKD